MELVTWMLMSTGETSRRMPSWVRSWKFIASLAPALLRQSTRKRAHWNFETKRIPSEREVPLVVRYKGTPLECYFRADFICYDEVLVELKAVERLTNVHQAQVINYLKATGLKRALLVNFGAARLEYRRIVLGYEG